MEKASQHPTTAPDPTTAPEPSVQVVESASPQFPDAQPWGRVGGSAYKISPPQEPEEDEVGKLGI